MAKLIICRGLPASGKSTYSKKWVLEDPKKRVRVNRDDIRRMLGQYWVPSREDLVTYIERESVLGALQKGFDVMLDATNIKSKPEHLNRWVSRIKEFASIHTPVSEQYPIEFKDFFDIPLDECMRRDAERGDERVGNAVISKFYEQLNTVLENE